MDGQTPPFRASPHQRLIAMNPLCWRFPCHRQRILAKVPHASDLVLGVAIERLFFIHSIECVDIVHNDADDAQQFDGLISDCHCNSRFSVPVEVCIQAPVDRSRAD
jgi:hypothetical protein